MITELLHDDSSRVAKCASNNGVDVSLWQILQKCRQSPDSQAQKKSQINRNRIKYTT